MTAETDIAALTDGGANPISEIRTALTSVLARADTSPLTDLAIATHVLVNNTVTQITWDSVLVAGLGGFDLGTDATIWTVQTTGVYEILVGWTMVGETGGTGQRLTRLHKNGTLLFDEGAGSSVASISGIPLIWAGSLTAGDDMDIRLYQAIGSNKTASVTMKISKLG